MISNYVQEVLAVLNIVVDPQTKNELKVVLANLVMDASLDEAFEEEALDIIEDLD